MSEFVVVGQYTPTDAEPDEEAVWRAFGFDTLAEAHKFVDDNGPWFPSGCYLLDVERG